MVGLPPKAIPKRVPFGPGSPGAPGEESLPRWLPHPGDEAEGDGTGRRNPGRIWPKEKTTRIGPEDGLCWSFEFGPASQVHRIRATEFVEFTRYQSGKILSAEVGYPLHSSGHKMLGSAQQPPFGSHRPHWPSPAKIFPARRASLPLARGGIPNSEAGYPSVPVRLGSQLRKKKARMKGIKEDGGAGGCFSSLASPSSRLKKAQPEPPSWRHSSLPWISFPQDFCTRSRPLRRASPGPPSWGPLG